MSKGKLKSLGIIEQIEYVYDIAMRNKGGGQVVVPTKTSDLTNNGSDGTAPYTTLGEVENAGFITEDWVNDKDFITDSDFKTINGNTILGPGDLVVGGTKVVTNGSNTGIQTVNGGTAAHLEIGLGSVDLVYATSPSKGVSGNYSFACGRDTTSSGSYSFACGGFTIASGSSSFASGNITIASGYYSFAGGSSTIAWAYSHFAIGVFNTTGTAQTSLVNGAPIFTVGNGTSPTSRSNAYQLYNDGRSEQLSDFEITTKGKGVVLKSPRGTRYRTTINIDGSHEIREIDTGNESFNSKIRNQRNGLGIKFWTGTETEYDALGLADPDTLYFITD